MFPNNYPFNFSFNNLNSINILNNQMNEMNNNNNFNNFQNQNMNYCMNNQFNNFNLMNLMHNNNNIQINERTNIPNNNMNLNMNNNQNYFLNFNNNNKQNFNQNSLFNQCNNLNLNANSSQNIQRNENNEINDYNSQQNQMIDNSSDDDDDNVHKPRKKELEREDFDIEQKLNITTTIEGTKTIYKQMKNCICKIGEKDTGFFCNIPYKGNKIPVLITSEDVINDDFLEKNDEIIVWIDDNKLKKKIRLKNNILYKNEKFNIIIITIKPNDIFNENFYFLEYDGYLNANNSLYILHYMEKDKSSVSYVSFSNQVGQYLLYTGEVNF